MGISIMLSRCSCDCRDKPSAARNPDPKNFRIVHATVVGKYTIAKINYLGCTNYEGDKILVFENIQPHELGKLDMIDPRFCKNPNHVVPIARFVPEAWGWDMAVTFVNAMMNGAKE